MKLVDANVLVHAANADAREHASARKWIEAAFLGHRANRIRVDRAARVYSRFYSTRSASQASQNCRRVRSCRRLAKGAQCSRRPSGVKIMQQFCAASWSRLALLEI